MGSPPSAPSENESRPTRLAALGIGIGLLGLALLGLWPFLEQIGIRYFRINEFSGTKAIRLRHLLDVLDVLTPILGGTLLLVGVVTYRWRSAIGRRIGASMTLHAEQIEKLSSRQAARALALYSVLGLFLEILIIRWLGSEFHLFAYFKNFALLSCFLGMGVGFAMARTRRSTWPFFPWLLLVLVGLALIGSRSGFFHAIRFPPVQDEFTWFIPGGSSAWALTAVFAAFVLFFFLLNTIAFIPLGDIAGRLLKVLPPIQGYSINISGNLVGIWLFSILGMMRTIPLVWYLVGVAVALLAGYTTRSRGIVKTAIPYGLLLLALLVTRTDALWSPYYRISELAELVLKEKDGAAEVNAGKILTVNEDYYQYMLDLSPEFVAEHSARHPKLKKWLTHYDLPYQLAQTPERVLIVGAGTGNDVAAALRAGCGRVDAVEIDPSIVELGREFHPERPYSDPRVRVIINDARAHFRSTEEKYDAVVFGLLDSHALLSAFSSVRLDNFVYTMESLEEVKGLLDPERGAVILSFAVGSNKWMGEKIRRMIDGVFGRPSLIFRTPHDGGMVFYNGPVLGHLDELGVAGHEVTAPDTRVDTPTDDWPYLYVRQKSIPLIYRILVVLAVVVSILMVLLAFPGSRKIRPHFFLLGAAFLLVEVNGVTWLALVYGTTWIVASVVITGVMIFILLANYTVTRFKVPYRLSYALLGITLAVDYLFGHEIIAALGPSVAKYVAPIVLLCPVYFAGLIFATSLKVEIDIPRAYSSNLLGAMVGGFLEYGSMVFGVRALYLGAIVMYALSALVLRRRIPE